MSNRKLSLGSFGKAINIWKPSAPSITTSSLLDGVSSNWKAFDVFDLDPEPTSSESATHPKQEIVWEVDAQLTVSTSKKIAIWEDLIEELDAIIDHYYGPSNQKEIFIIIYYLLGTHLKPGVGVNGEYKKFVIELSKRIKFSYNFEGIQREAGDISWTYSQSRARKRLLIDFRCSITPTKRDGIPLKKLYDFQIYPNLPHPSIGSLLSGNDITVLDVGTNYSFAKKQ
ncbi:matrix protein [Wuhan House Fly Virus 1]|uniref:Matrix protein n=1 Tax=Wuhan House Fly Virus 1 TaxID=1608104 RepID=A0A0B5KRM5_9RHAB|nr:matrix protein [Wuhan House Fly Virus 1]AJG39166.1 matrix protein [Wuhan House Fly Virus 1]